MLSFERGDGSRPRGHALVYFRDAADPDRLVASYIVVPPVTMDFAKYVPPLFAGQFEHLVPQGPVAFPLPPVPEPVDGYEAVSRLTEARDDDLLDGGRVNVADVQRLMASVGEVTAEYTQAYLNYIGTLPSVEPGPPSEAPAFDTDEILLEVMTESEKVERLAKLTGTLRYAAEGHDETLARDTAVAMRKIGRRLPEHYEVERLIDAAESTASPANQLVSLYIERCYTLARQDYAELARLEERIRVARGAGE